MKIGPKNFCQVKDGDDLSMLREGLMGALSVVRSCMLKVIRMVLSVWEEEKMVMNMMWKLVTRQMGSPFWRPVRCFRRIPDTVMPQITGAEYFIDSDPGEGNGLSVGAEDLVYDSATEGIAALSVGINDVPAGARRMGLRFRDQDGNWSTPRYIDFESEDAEEYIPSRVEINHPQY